ncbi:MAG TPA: glycine betaine ABC transporter substrate-binding protein [Actinomycetales bacterium]|nr:glycine betaine ABC transporter substrate-binding protein [Actinomycetales bacterium]
MRNKRFLSIAALGAAAALTLGACGADDNGDSDNGTENGGTTETDDTNGESEGGEGSEDKTISISIHSGWDEGIAVSYLWKAALEEAGYEVELGDPAEAGPNYVAIAGGDFDLNFDMWLPITHEDYWDEYGDDMEQLGYWYDQAVLTIAVNEDAPIDSLTELADHADEFGNRIVGIEPGAGLTRVTQDEAIPTYGLEGMDFVESSTPAMLAELSGATDNNENIVVTLWRPHWAYDEFPIKDLEDPEGAMGDAEKIYMVGRDGFSADHPEVAEAIGNFKLTDEQLFSLENIMFNEDGGEDPEGSLAKWLEDEDNKAFFDSMLG